MTLLSYLRSSNEGYADIRDGGGSVSVSQSHKFYSKFLNIHAKLLQRTHRQANKIIHFV